ncbi:MAG: hypothetical protein O7D31_06095 [Alphaproteobacteria bacterium]|nr:hypothetical protein [Alphaproteobacteria bacterium]
MLPRFAQQIDPGRLVEDEFAGLLAGVGEEIGADFLIVGIEDGYTYLIDRLKQG